jgi:hypothetical protein
MNMTPLRFFILSALSLLFAVLILSSLIIHVIPEYVNNSMAYVPKVQETLLRTDTLFSYKPDSVIATMFFEDHRSSLSEKECLCINNITKNFQNKNFVFIIDEYSDSDNYPISNKNIRGISLAWLIYNCFSNSGICRERLIIRSLGLPVNNSPSTRNRHVDISIAAAQ